MRNRFVDRVPKLLRETAFRRYWTGYSLSQLGSQVSALAFPLTAVLVLHANSRAMGLLAMAGMAPSLLFSIHAGAWVDRFGRRRQVMIVADIARAALLACVPVAFLLGRLNLPGLLLISFLVSTFGVLFRVSATTLFVSLVPKERYVEANSLLQGSRAMAFLTGPGIAGILVELLSAPVAILADALSFAASALSLARIHSEEPAAAAVQRGKGHATAGLRFTWQSPILRASLTATTAISLFQSVFMTLYVLYVTSSLQVTPAELGIILGPASVGAVFGSALAGRLSKQVGLGRTLLIGMVLYAAPLILVPMVRGHHLVVVGLLFLAECFSGMGLMVQEVSNGSILAAAIPDQIRARVGGAMGFVNTGIRMAGALAGGVLPSLIGLHTTMWVATLGASLGCLWLLPSPIISLRDVGDFLVRPS